MIVENLTTTYINLEEKKKEGLHDLKIMERYS